MAKSKRLDNADLFQVIVLDTAGHQTVVGRSLGQAQAKALRAEFAKDGAYSKVWVEEHQHTKENEDDSQLAGRTQQGRQDAEGGTKQTR